MLKKVSILTHPRSREAAALADQAERTLRGAGPVVERVHRSGGRDRTLDPATDILLAIGGDGTVLRAQRLAVKCAVPVLGVSAGRLGFLAEVAPPDLDSALSRTLRGDFTTEERRLIKIVHFRGGDVLAEHHALNDAVLARGRAVRSLWIDVRVDGANLNPYVADGIIAATATGSTAYSLAAGGPILAPNLTAILLTPIAAHISFVQSIILPETARIELSLVRSQDALLSVDGQVDAPVLYGDTMLITTSSQSARFVRLSPASQFYTQLVSRLQYNRPRPHTP